MAWTYSEENKMKRGEIKVGFEVHTGGLLTNRGGGGEIMI